VAHLKLDDLDWCPIGRNGFERAVVTLDAGDTCDNPASTKRDLFGPAVVTFERYPDGGILVIEREV
jgi:hypothetical protein